MATYDLAEFDAGVAGVTYDLALFNAICGGVNYQLAELGVDVGQDFQVSLGVNPATFDPFDIATLTASSVLVPDSWTFAQIDGFGGSVITPTVTLSGSGGTRTYKCPGRLSTQTLYFRVTATLGAATSVAEVRHTIAPHAGKFGAGGIGWDYHPGPYVPGGLYLETLGLFPDTGLYVRT
jgi:hypothetical protein